MTTTQNTSRLGEQVLGVLRAITRALDLHSKVLAAQFGITGPQLAVLLLLEPGERGPKQLAAEISLSPATVTGIVSRLKAKGLVESKRSGVDGRRVDISITERGRSVLEQAPPPLHASILSGLGGLQEWEQNQMLSTLQRLASFVTAPVPPVTQVGAGSPGTVGPGGIAGQTVK